MKAAWFLPLLLAVVFCVPVALAQGVQVVSLTEAASTTAGLTVGADHWGPLPATSPAARDLPQMPGWPITISVNATFKPTRGAVLADLDSDGDLEIIVGSTDSKLYAWNYSGSPMPGFPVSLIGWAQYPPSIGDLDGDGDFEIVQCTRGQTSGGRLYALDHLGHVLPGFPISINNNNVEDSPTLYDLDHDGMLEIIVGERAYPIGRLHIFEPNGSEWGGNWPVTLDHVPTGAAAVGDVDADGDPEIFYLSYNSMYLLETDGTLLPGWPKQIPNANFSYQSAALADLDHDGDLEIIVAAHKDAAGCYVFHHDGTTFPGWPKLVGTWTYCPPTVTDLEGDGTLEILCGRAGYMSGASACFWAWDAYGNVKPGFPYVSTHGGGSDGPLTVADINGDGKMEIFADHNMSQSGQGWLFGVDMYGHDLPNFPLRPTGFTYMNGATIGDVDDDGQYELAVISYGDYTAAVNLYTLPDSYRTTGREWPTYHARNRRGGLYHPVLLGDLNCDGLIDFGDINPFVLLLSDPGAWQAQYPGCPMDNGDINEDGAVDFGDINPFVALLSGT